MTCFVFGYVGDGVSVRNLLYYAGQMVKRTIHSYGLACWTEFDESTYVRIRSGCLYSDFVAEKGVKDMQIDGPVARYFKEKGFNDLSEVMAKKIMIHGRFPTVPAAHSPESQCHPFEHTKEYVRVVGIHNGGFEPFERYYDLLKKQGFIAETQESDSAVMFALLTKYCCDKGARESGKLLCQTVREERSTAATLFTHSQHPRRIFGTRYLMPLCIAKTNAGYFIASDPSILNAMDDESAEIYCLRDGGVVEVDASDGIVWDANAFSDASGHYGKMTLQKRRISNAPLLSCNRTKTGKSRERDWDLRTTLRWKVYPDEEECLACACEKAERAIKMPLNAVTDVIRVEL